MFAEDTALVAEPAKQFHCQVTEFGRACEGMKLRVNVEKARLWWWEGKGLHPRWKL